MYLKDLSLINYKNFSSQSFTFDPKINCLVGENGIGKTNVLDSIYHLAYGKSYFNPVNIQNINHEADFFVIEGKFDKEDKNEDILISVKKGQKKIIKRNGKTYDRVREHIGLIPVVIISPADRDLITEGSSIRRKFIDGIIAQSDAAYLQHLLRYNQALSQRNALLKFFAANHTFSQDNIEIYNRELQNSGQYLFEKRKSFIEIFLPIFQKRYQTISNQKEEVSLTYKSQLHEQEWEALFQESMAKDRVVQYTTKGVHKDDLVMKIEDFPIKRFGSQGQQKSFLIALKLAQYDFINDQLKTKPILLLDDIFDKLDEKRVTQLVQLVTTNQLGQLFISDTHKERTENVVKATSDSYKMIEL